MLQELSEKFFKMLIPLQSYANQFMELHHTVTSCALYREDFISVKSVK
jgi:hypothetical protein